MHIAERMSCPNIPSLELRRLHLDLIFCHKVVFGLPCVNFDDFFTSSPSSQARGPSYKLYELRSRNAARRIFFIDGVVNLWNMLPSTVNFNSLSTFGSSLNSVDFSAYLKCTV